MKRALVLLFAITSTVACAEREKEAPAPTPTEQAPAPLATMVKPPQGFVVKKPLNIGKVDNVGAPDLPSASASAPASAAPSTK
jgi:hypothetical protein